MTDQKVVQVARYVKFAERRRASCGSHRVQVWCRSALPCAECSGLTELDIDGEQFDIATFPDGTELRPMRWQYRTPVVAAGAS